MKNYQVCAVRIIQKKLNGNESLHIF